MRRSRFFWFVAAAILMAAVLENSHLRADDSPANAAVRQALKKQVKLDYAEEPLEQVIKDLQTKLGIPVFLDAKAINDAGIAKDMPVTFTIANVSAKAAIASLLRSLGLTTTVRHGMLMIVTPEEAENLMDTRVYEVADLVTTGEPGEGPPNFDQLIDVIKSCVRPTTWDDVGGPGSIATFESPGIKGDRVLANRPDS